MRHVLSGWLERLRLEHWLCALAVAFSLLVRLGSLKPVNNPDAVHKWAAARAIVSGAGIPAREFDHHAARLGITVPTALVQAVFGDAAWAYFLPMLLLTSLLAYLTYRVGAVVAGPWAGALAVVVYTPLPCLAYVGSQLMPEMVQSCFVMGSLLTLLRLGQTGARRYLGYAALWFFGAYLAKESVIFFLPGLLTAAWLVRKRFADALVFATSFGVGIGLETLAYRLHYGFTWGRLSVVHRHHLGNAKMRAPIDSVSDLLVRYLDLQLGFRELFYAGLLASVVLLWQQLRERKHDRNLYALLAVCWSFYFCSTFALKSLDPPRIVQPLNERYLFAGVPFLALLTTIAVAAFVREPVPPGRQVTLLRGLAATCALLGAVVWFVRSPPSATHAFASMARSQAELRAGFERGLPIVNPEPKRYATDAVLEMFLSPAQAKRARVAYPQQGKKKVRVIVNGRHARFRGLGKRELTRAVAAWHEHPHVLIRMKHGFRAHRYSEIGGLAASR